MLQTILRPPRTAEDIAQGARLAKMQGRHIGLMDVVRVLRAAGIKHLIVGAHAVNGYNGRPRATVDVDAVVQHPKKACRAVAAAFPQLVMRDTPVVTRFMDGDTEAIDIMKPTSSPLWNRLLKDAREVKMGEETIRIPSLEGVLAAKFASMSSIGRRRSDRHQDATDFMRILEVNEKTNRKMLQELGDLVYPDGGERLLKLVHDVREGNPLEI